MLEDCFCRSTKFDEKPVTWAYGRTWSHVSEPAAHVASVLVALCTIATPAPLLVLLRRNPNEILQRGREERRGGGEHKSVSEDLGFTETLVSRISTFSSAPLSPKSICLTESNRRGPSFLISETGGSFLAFS